MAAFVMSAVISSVEPSYVAVVAPTASVIVISMPSSSVSTDVARTVKSPLVRVIVAPAANDRVALAFASALIAEVIWALVAAAAISTSTSICPVAPRLAWLISRSWTSSKFCVAEVMKPRLPSNSFLPWKVVVWAIRLIASSDESTWSWLAVSCSSLIAPMLAASVTRPRMSFSRELISPRALSAVAII